MIQDGPGCFTGTKRSGGHGGVWRKRYPDYDGIFNWYCIDFMHGTGRRTMPVNLNMKRRGGPAGHGLEAQ